MTTDTKQCPFCAETIKAEAVVCRFCGRDLVSPAAVKSTPTTPTPTPTPAQSKPKNKVVTQIIGVLVLGCCGLLALSAIVSGGNSKKTEGSPSQAASNQNSSQPTVISPTSQPPTLQPLAPSIQEILATAEGMTDAQRNQYSESLKGNRVEGWRGTIDDVDEGEIFGGFTIYIDMVTENFGAEVHIDVSKEVALSLNKGQEIVFSGNIKSVSDILGITVFIENATIEPAN